MDVAVHFYAQNEVIRVAGLEPQGGIWLGLRTTSLDPACLLRVPGRR